jgi:hypothetical protein
MMEGTRVRRAVALCGLFAALAVGAAACGGDDDNGGGGPKERRFQSQYEQIRKQLIEPASAALGEALEAAPSQSDAEIAETFQEREADIAEILDRLRELEPPGDLEDETDSLIRSLDDVQTNLDNISLFASRHQITRAIPEAQRLAEHVETAGSARDDLEDELGIDD